MSILIDLSKGVPTLMYLCHCNELMNVSNFTIVSGIYPIFDLKPRTSNFLIVPNIIFVPFLAHHVTYI